VTLMFRSDGTEGLESGNKADLQVPLLVNDVKEEWSLLWCDRINDKVRAEGVANRDYPSLFVDRGTVIIATRDFKPLDLKEILRLHRVQNAEGSDPPHPSLGGWGKFARTVLNKQRRSRKPMAEEFVLRRKHEENLQLKKGGRGWLHYRLTR